MATKAAITKVLSSALIFVILMSAMHVSVFAVNDSNNSMGNVSNRSNELVNSFMVNNYAEAMIPLFNNNTTDNYRAWTEEDSSSGDCVEQNNAFHVPARAHTTDIRKNGCSGELPKIKDEEYLAHDDRFPFYLTKSKDQIVQEAGIEKSNYTFTLQGNVKLLWSYVNDERYADVDFEILDDINGDGIYDILISDCNLSLLSESLKSENRLFVISGNDRSAIWTENYPVEIENDNITMWLKGIDELDDVNGDGIDEAIVYWFDYDWTSNKTNITIELLSGSDGTKIWNKTMNYVGYLSVKPHGINRDLNGDGIEDILVEWNSGYPTPSSEICALSGKDGSKLWNKTFEAYVHGYCLCPNDLTGDGIYDFAISAYNWSANIGDLFVIRGSDGYVEWHKSFVGDVGWVHPRYDFDGDGLIDVDIENNDIDNKTGKVFIFKGTDGSIIWSKVYNSDLREFGSDDINGDGTTDLRLILVSFITHRVTDVQVLSGIDGSLIWSKGINVSNAGGVCDDLNKDGKRDILLFNSTKIAENTYLYDVIAISGVDGSEIWKNSFMHDVGIEIPEGTSTWTQMLGFSDFNGDGITDPLLQIDYHSYRDPNTSSVYTANKLFLINGIDGSELWNVEYTLDEHGFWEWDHYEDFNNDGIDDVLLGTGKGVYLLTTTAADLRYKVHNINTGEDFANIQAAIDAASPGNTITVDPGIYTENVDVSKSLTIKSTSGNPKDTIVQAANPGDYAFCVWTDYVNISGFTVKGATGDGSAGIHIRANYCNISNNNCSSNEWYGILLNFSNNNIISKNNCSNNRDGIYIRYSNGNTISKNNCLSNRWPLCGISLTHSNNNTISDNTCSNNSVGVSLGYSNNNTISNNNCSNNKMSSGIHIWHSRNNIISKNNCSHNSWGISTFYSNDNIIYLNNFAENAIENVDSLKSANTWNSPSKITYTHNGNTFTSYLGNYWDDYKDKYPGAKEKDNAGIWDTPYEIDGDKDNYPLMEPWENYFVTPTELPDLTLSPGDISFSNPNPRAGDTITITVTIHNIGNADATDVIVQFFNGEPLNGTQIGTDRIIDLIIAGGNETTNVIWNAETYGSVHDIYVKIDHQDNIKELKENNNEANKRIMVGCTTEINAKKILLKHLNYIWNYDFYEKYYGYEDNATAPDLVKDPVECTIPLEEDDIWITRFSTNTPGLYPFSAALIGPEIGFDTNSWYNWSTPVKGITYPELEIKSIDKWINAIPYIGEDLEELLKGLLNASEFSIKLDGVYAYAPINWNNKTNESWIPLKISGKAIGPGIEEGLDCESDFKKIYDIDDGDFRDNFDNVVCRVGIGLPVKEIGYNKTKDIDASVFEFNGTVMLECALFPSANGGARFKINPLTLIPAGKSDLNAELSVSIEGNLVISLPSPFDDINQSVNITLPTPSLANPATLIGEVVIPFQDYEERDYIESVYTNFSGCYFRYEDLDALAPVLRINTYPIVVNYTLCFNLTELGVPCGGILPISCEEVCLFDGTLFTIDEWEQYWSFNILNIHSPVDVHVYDSMGRHIGPNATNGGVDLIIPNSTYMSNGSVKTLMFPTTTEKFIVFLNGTDAGIYNMTVYRPILISGVNNTNIIKGITYRLDNVSTNTGKEDYLNINFDEIEKQTNEKVHSGKDITSAIKEATDLIIFEENVTKHPTTLFVSDLFGTNNNPLILYAKLMSLDKHLSKRTILFEIGGDIVGQATTDVNGTGTLSYTIPRSMKPGAYKISARYGGDDIHNGAEGYATLNLRNQPPEVRLDLPSYTVNGIILIKGTIIDLNLEQVILKIDNITVANSIPYLWHTTNYTNGLHQIQLIAMDSFGDVSQSMAFIIVDNTLPSGKMIYVDDDFIDDPVNHRWCTIQKGITDASSGDTIIVRDGIYTENIDVNKPHLTITSENGAENCIVLAANSNDHAFEVSADYVNISGFTVKPVRSPSGYASAIVLVGVKDCEIFGNSLNFSSHGIALVNSGNNLLKENTVKNAATGISLRDSSNYNIIRNNTLEMNNNGIFLYNLQHDIGSDENTITCNRIVNNYYCGIKLRKSNSNIIYLNDFINNPDNVYSYESTNLWNSPSKITYTYNGNSYTRYLGNYWDDYTRSDADGDGIGDTPYGINTDKDFYPLLMPVENYIKQPTITIDTTPPEVICPADETVELETIEGTVVPLEAVATDNSDPYPIIASNELNIYPPGTTIVTFTATDASGNSASCSTNVAVVDTTPPVITVEFNIEVGHSCM